MVPISNGVFIDKERWTAWFALTKIPDDTDVEHTAFFRNSLRTTVRFEFFSIATSAFPSAWSPR